MKTQALEALVVRASSFSLDREQLAGQGASCQLKKKMLSCRSSGADPVSEAKEIHRITEL